MAELTQRFDTLVDIYQGGVRKFAERPLFGTKVGAQWHWITYRQFGDLIDRMRGGLASLGVGRGDRVAIISNNRVEWAVIAGATYMLGGTVVPMYETQLDKDWKYIIADCAAKMLVVADEAIAGRVSAFGDSFPCLLYT